LDQKKKLEFNPSKHELARIKEMSDGYNALLSKIEKLGQFKVGDYLIKTREWPRHMNDGHPQKEVQKNSYGVPVKYVVLHVEGKVPFAKRITAKGTPIGSLECCIPELDDDDTSQWEWHFELDPDYTDAVILDSVDDYDAAAIHKQKRDTFKDVTDHNKANKVNCHKFEDIVQFMNDINVGESYWVSTRSSILVQEKLSIVNGTIPYNRRGNFGSKNVTVPILKCVNNKGESVTIYPLDLYRTNVYKARPRSYKELKDPNL